MCLDVINQTWSPMYDMVNIFEVFLPQLLRYPNPTDPLNGEAAALLMKEPKAYDIKVKGELLESCILMAGHEAGIFEREEQEIAYANGIHLQNTSQSMPQRSKSTKPASSPMRATT